MDSVMIHGFKEVLRSMAFGLALLLISGSFSVTQAAVTRIGTWTQVNNNTTVNPGTGTLALGASASGKRAVVLAVSFDWTTTQSTGATTATASYGGQPMTSAAWVCANTTGGRCSGIFYLLESGIVAAAGNTATSINITGTGGAGYNFVSYGATFDNVSQTNPIADFSTNSSVAASVTTLNFGKNVAVGIGDQLLYIRTVDATSTFTLPTNYTHPLTDSVAAHSSVVGQRNVPVTDLSENISVIATGNQISTMSVAVLNEFRVNTLTSCAGCHGYPNGFADGTARNTPEGAFLGDHAKHNYVCSTCHLVPTDETSANFAHRDGKINVKSGSIGVTDNGTYTGGSTINQVNNPVTGTCAAVNCHANAVTPQWGVGTTACDNCHALPPATNAHTKHYTSKAWATGSFAMCVVCHPDNTAGHSDVTNNSVTVNGSLTPTGVSPAITCAATPASGCHNDKSTPAWNTTGITCANCHTVGGAALADPTSGLHAGVMITTGNTHDDSFNNGAAGLADCITCHTATPSTNHFDGTFTSSWNAVAPSINFAATAGFLDAATPTCGPNGALVACHDDGGAWKRKWSVSAKINDDTRCANCHGDFTAGFVTGMSLRHQTAAGDPNLGVANNHDDAGGTLKCYICHAYGDASYTGGMHRDNNIQINSNVTVVDNGTTLGCTGCHSTLNVLTTDGNHGFDDVVQVYGRWTYAPISGPVADCNSCHTSNGMTHASANESATVHTNHTGYTLLGASDCTDCHTNAGSGVDHNNATVNFGNKLSNTINYAKAANYGGTCAAASNGCHDSDAGEWIANNLGADACADCHATAAGTMGTLTGRVYPPTSAKHPEHLANNVKVPNDCADCHGTGAATGTHTGHKNGGIDDSVTYVAGTQTCTNTCHLANTATDWTAGGSLVCTDCHTATGLSLYTGAVWPPTSNKHPQHLDVTTPVYGDAVNHSSASQYDYGCGSCHGNVATNHANGTTNITVTNWTLAAKTCGTNACHQDGNAGPPLVTADWDAAAPTQNCNMCHGNSPSTAAHSVHTVGIHYQDIYTGTTGRATSGNTTSSAHGNTATSTTINCNLCHSTAMTVSYNAANTICATCHSDTNLPATGFENAVIADKSVHVNGSPNVVFANVLVKSKAQARNFTATVPELNNTWTRTGGYKVAGAYDAAKTSLTGGSWNGTSCSAVSCHNGIAVTWATPTSDCTKCHTALP